MVRSSVVIIGWVSGVVSISVAILVMRSSVVWGSMNIVVGIVSPEVLVMWSDAMMGISISVEAAMVWGSMSVSEESVALFFSGANGCDNC